MRRRQDSGLEEHRVASSAERRGDGDDLPALQSTATTRRTRLDDRLHPAGRDSRVEDRLRMRLCLARALAPQPRVHRLPPDAVATRDVGGRSRLRRVPRAPPYTAVPRAPTPPAWRPPPLRTGSSTGRGHRAGPGREARCRPATGASVACVPEPRPRSVVQVPAPGCRLATGTSHCRYRFGWSGRRDSNPRPSRTPLSSHTAAGRWPGDTPPQSQSCSAARQQNLESADQRPRHLRAATPGVWPDSNKSAKPDRCSSVLR